MSPIASLFAAALLSLTAGSSAQLGAPPAVGLALTDGQLTGAGPGYRVDFGDEVVSNSRPGSSSLVLQDPGSLCPAGA
jgi:hypothetical protein